MAIVDQVGGTGAAGADAGGEGLFARARSLFARVNWRAYTLVIVLVVIWGLFQIMSGGTFLSPANLRNLVLQSTLTAVLSMGMLLVIVSGNIDLSVGSSVYFLAVVASWCQVMWDWPAIPTLLVIMVIAVVIGVFHGFWVSRLHVPAMIVTLGSMLFLRGFGLLITKGLQIQGMDDIFRVISDGALSLPWTLAVVGVSYLSYLVVVLRRRRAAQRNGRAGRQATGPWMRAAGVLVAAAVVTLVFSGERGFPVALLFLAIMSVIFQFLIRDTRFGRYVYAIGGNRDAAAMSGIPVARYTFLVFALMGAMYGLGSWYLTARLNGSSAVTGLMLESDVIAACVIGGASLSGGSGTLMGAVLGAVLMESLRNGMTLLGLVYNWQYISKGIILLVAAWIDIASRSKSGDTVRS